MADETNDHLDPDTPPDETDHNDDAAREDDVPGTEQISGPSAEATNETPGDAEGEDDSDAADDPAGVGADDDWPLPSDTLDPARRRLTFGMLTMFTRWGTTIEIPFDSSNALRLIACHELHITQADKFNPYTANVHAAWLSVALDDVVVMLWTPGLPEAPRRTVIDPVLDFG